jgi:4-hydroxy-tetrahydrodipicolinate synthase
MASFEGCYTVLVTPFDESGESVDVRALKRLVDWQIEEGVPGLVALGSTGEFLSLTDDEREVVAATVIGQARGRVPVLIGTGDEWTLRCTRYSQDAERLGADGVMIIPPYYSTPTDDEIFAHYAAVGAAIGIPIMVYNNPRTANVDLKPPLVARLAQIDNVRYVKEASGEAVRTIEIHELTKGRMTVFARYESFYLGAKGYVSVFGNILPRQSADLYRLAVSPRGDDRERARSLYRNIAPLLKVLGGDFYVSATKAALQLVGRPMGLPRMPRLPCPADRVAELRRVLQPFLNVVGSSERRST